MVPISLIQERHILLPGVMEIGERHGVEMDITVNFAKDVLILGAYCATGSYQGVLITRHELETTSLRYYDLINERINAAIKIVKPDALGDACEYEEIMQAQEIMEEINGAAHQG